MTPAKRRDILKGALGLGLAWRVGSDGVGAQDDRASARPEAGDLLVKPDDSSKTPLRPQDVAAGAGQMMVWAMEPGSRTVRSGSRLNQIILLRFDPAALATDTRAGSADGIVAYTSICTHTGCDVDTWLAPEQRLSCPCHDSVFDPKDGGRVVDGPAPRVLPALPLTIADGKLVVAGPFTSPVGFERG